jgi:hypothetical protein
MQPSETASVLQMLFWLAAVAGGAFAIWKHFAESKERRLWEKAKLAKQMLDDLDANAKALDATCMLGAWTGRRYSRNGPTGTDLFEVNQEQVRAVLDPSRAPRSLNETYVRDCFDNLLFHIELCACAAQRGLIEWREMEPMLATLLAGTERATLAPLVGYSEYLCYSWRPASCRTCSRWH